MEATLENVISVDKEVREYLGKNMIYNNKINL